MKEVANLLKKDFLNSFIMNIRYMWKTKKERKKLLLYPLLTLIFGAYLYFIIRYTIDFIDVYDRVGKGDIYLLQAVFVYTTLILLTSLTYVITNFYYSNDIQIMLPLPIKKEHILFSKIIYITASMLVTALFIVTPFLIRYGAFYNKSILFYLAFIVLLISHTILLVSIITFIAVALMSWLNKFSRARSIIQILGTLLIIVLSFGFSYFINATPDSIEGGDMLVQMMANSMDKIVTKVPSIDMIRQAINGNYLIGSLLVIASLLIAGLVSKVSGPMLEKGVNYNSTVSKRKGLSDKEKAGVLKVRKPIWDIFYKDMSEIFKTPTYALNTLLMGLVIPLAFAVPIIAQRNSLNELVEEIGYGFSDLPLIFSVFEGFVSRQYLFTIILLASIVLLMFLSSSAINTAGTSITREGKYLWLMQTLPIHAQEQIFGRVLSALVIYAISIMPMTLLIFILFRPPYYFYLAYLLAAISCGFFSANLGILVDVMRPKTDWQTPQQAMKNNMNPVLLTYAVLILAGVLGFVSYRLIVSNLGDTLFFIAGMLISLAFIIIGFIFNMLAISLFKKKLASYE